MSHRFDEQVAIVTGATAGIGAATARRLSEEGASVILSGRSDQRGARLAEQLGAQFVPGDITSEDVPARLIGAALERYGRLDVLVNNAAMDHTGDVLTTPMSEARNLFDVNVFAALRMLQHAGRAMAEGHGGSIVNVTSRLASVGVPTMSVYAATKGALLSLTRSAAVELAPRRVRVNAVAPGMTRTPLYEAWLRSLSDPERAEADLEARIPQARLALPEEVASAIAYLASSEASHVTGASVPVDGGYTAT